MLLYSVVDKVSKSDDCKDAADGGVPPRKPSDAKGSHWRSLTLAGAAGGTGSSPRPRLQARRVVSLTVTSGEVGDPGRLRQSLGSFDACA